MAGSFAAHAGLVRVLLRLPTLLDVSGAGSVFRLGQHHQGHCQTALYHRGFSSLFIDDTAGCDVNRWHDSPVGRKTLALVASPGLSICLGGVIHYGRLVKKDLTNPITFAVVLGLLLCIRLLYWLEGLRKQRLSARTVITP